MTRAFHRSRPAWSGGARGGGRTAARALSCVSALLVAGAAAGGGCTFALDAFGYVANECASDADCPGARCDATRAMCVSDTAPELLRVGFEVTVPSADGSGGASVTSIPPLPIVRATERDFVVPRPVTVAGLVRRGSIEGKGVEAEITFTPGSVVPGRRPPVVTVAASEARVAFGDGRTDYLAQLAPGTEYTAWVVPRGADAASLPPLRLPERILLPEGGPTRVDVVYPEVLPEIAGSLVDGSGAPIEGLTVQAIDPEAGGVVVSTTAISDAAGEFTLHLSPTAGRWVLRVGGIALAPDVPSPAFDVDPTYLYPDATGRARVLVPMLRVVHYSGQVGLARAPGVPLEGATVELRAESLVDLETNTEGRFRTAPTTTDHEGRFVVALVPGTYQVVVRPPASDAYADVGLLVERVVIPDTAGASLAGQAFDLPSRPRLTGAVRTHDGRALEGANVIAMPLGIDTSGGAELALRFNRVASGATGEDGQFSMPIDPGLYDVVVKAFDGSGFPWTVLLGLEVLPGASALRRDLVMQAPLPLGGRVVDATGAALAGAEIRAYAVIDAPDALPRSVEIGRATTTAEGRYELLLPPGLAP
jgi:hypothetical protein